MELRVVENPSVFRHANVESVLVSESCHCVIHDAGFAVDALHDVVLEARRFRENQHGFVRRGGQTSSQRQAGARYGCDAKKFPATCRCMCSCAHKFVLSGVLRGRSEEHTSELQSLTNLVCRLLLEKKKTQKYL